MAMPSRLRQRRARLPSPRVRLGRRLELQLRLPVERVRRDRVRRDRVRLDLVRRGRQRRRNRQRQPSRQRQGRDGYLRRCC